MPSHEKEMIRLRADLKCLHELKNFIVDYASQNGFDEKRCNQIELAADEILTNIINYAYPEKEGDIRIICDSGEDDTLLVQIIDAGIPFNPLEVAEPDVSLALEERKVGGLGLFLARKMVDDMRYRRHSGENILTLYKKKID